MTRIKKLDLGSQKLPEPPEPTADREVLRAWAKQAYIVGKQPEEIAAVLEMTDKDVRNWVYSQGWRKDRDKLIQNQIKKVVRLSSNEIKSVLAKALRTIKRSIDTYEKEKKVLNPAEMSQVAGTFERLFKVSQLLTNNPTEILQGATLDQVMLKLRSVDILDYGKVIDATGNTIRDDSAGAGRKGISDSSGFQEDGGRDILAGADPDDNG